MNLFSCRIYLMRRFPSMRMPSSNLARVERKCRRVGISRQLFCSLLVCTIVFSSVAYAGITIEELLSAAEQRLHWTGLYLPGIEINIGQDSVVTVSGTVANDVVKSEVVETLQMTDGIRGVIDRLVVAP